MKKFVFEITFIKMFLIFLLITIISIFSIYALYTNFKINNILNNYKNHIIRFIDNKKDLDYHKLAKSISFFYNNYEVHVISDNGSVVSSSNNNLEKVNLIGKKDVLKAINFKDSYIIDKDIYSGKQNINISVRYIDYIYRLTFPYKDILFPFHIYLYILILFFLMFIIYNIVYYKIIKKFSFVLQDMISNLYLLKNNLKFNKIRYIGNKIIDDKIYKINYMFSSVYYKFLKIKLKKDRVDFVLDNMTTGIIQVDKNIHVKWLNRSAKELLNIDIDVINKNIIYAIQDKNVILSIEETVKKQKSTIIDIDLLNQIGKILSINISPTKREFINNNDKIRAIIFIDDVTRSRKIDQIKTEFVENISHELKTPLTSISGFTELIMSGVVKEKYKIDEYLKRIKRESDKISNLADDLLSIYILEQNKYNGIENEINILELINNIFDLLHLEIKKMNISYNIKGNAIIFANFDTIEKLLKNLIENSIKYNKNGGFINIDFYKKENKFYFTIEDSGIGIPIEHHTRVFERFYRVDKSRSRKTGGTGLGLSIVKHIVLKYNGNISLESEINKGTKIKIEINLNN